MNLRNENISIVLTLALVVLGQLLTGGDPTGAEAVLITVVAFGGGFVLADRLNERDRKRGRLQERSPFRR